MCETGYARTISALSFAIAKNNSPEGDDVRFCKPFTDMLALYHKTGTEPVKLFWERVWYFGGDVVLGLNPVFPGPLHH